jgi:predicted nucleic acid-binding protein
MYLLDTNACIEYLNGRSHHFLERLLAKMAEEITVTLGVNAVPHFAG